MRALAVTSKQRVATMPMWRHRRKRLGRPRGDAWYGFVAPKDTPPALIEKLQKATVAAISDTTVESPISNEGAKPVGNSPEEFGAFMKAEHRRWADIITSANLVLN